MATVWRLLAFRNAISGDEMPSVMIAGSWTISQLSEMNPTSGPGVIDGVSVGDGVGVMVGVSVAVGDVVGVGVSVGVDVAVGELVGVLVDIGVSVAVGVAVGADKPLQAAEAVRMNTNSKR